MRLKKTFFILMYLTILFLYSPVKTLANESESSGSSQISTVPSEIKATIQKHREEMRTKMQEQKSQLQYEMKQKRQDFLEQLQQKRNDFKEQMMASKEAFLKNLQTIRDERKKDIVTKLDTMIKTVNKKQTDQMLSVLIRLSNMLKEIMSKATTAKNAGADTTAFDTAAKAAQDAISEAQTAVTTQAGKEYTISITTEDALKTAVGTTKSQMESDMATTRQLVIKAKESVIQAARELAKLKKNISITPSVSPTP